MSVTIRKFTANNYGTVSREFVLTITNESFISLICLRTNLSLRLRIRRCLTATFAAPQFLFFGLRKKITRPDFCGLAARNARPERKIGATEMQSPTLLFFTGRSNNRQFCTSFRRRNGIFNWSELIIKA